MGTQLTTRTLFYFLLFALTMGGGRADAPVQAAPVGIIVLKAVAGYDATAIAFVTIQWVDTNGGYVTDVEGKKTLFVNRGIGRIIYFDDGFYDEVDHNQYWVDWRAGIQSREIVVPPVSSLSLTAADLPDLKAKESVLEDTVTRYAAGEPLIAPLITSLKDDITQLSSGHLLRNGKWLTPQEAASSSAVPVVGESNRSLTFTTKDGKKYADVKITVIDGGLSVLTSDGGAFVPFDQLPNDLSAFSESMRTKIHDGETHVQAVAVAQAEAKAANTPPLTSLMEWLSLTAHRVENWVGSFFPSTSSSTPAAPAPSTVAAPAPASAPAPVTSTTGGTNAPAAPTPPTR